jgi:hypothetical protein
MIDRAAYDEDRGRLNADNERCVGEGEAGFEGVGDIANYMLERGVKVDSRS